MTLIHLILGLIPPTLIGWLALALLQYKKRVLFRGEQWVMGMVTGLLFMTLAVFIAHTNLEMPLTFATFALVQAVLLIFLGGSWFMLPIDKTLPVAPASAPLTKTATILFGVVWTWIIAKALLAATTFLFLTPTFLDDTLDNWNLRGKVFFYDQALTLVMPGEDPIASPLGISSYPPSVPMMKTWLATIAGDWSDSLANGIHVVWYAAAIALLYYVLRRLTSSIAWSLTGAAILGSIPLYLMHGTNPYADTFVSVHVFLAIALPLLAYKEADATARMSFFHLGAFAAALLPFTKNEGVLMYLPPLAIILCTMLWLLRRSGRMTMRDVVTVLCEYGMLILILGLPWLSFKWLNGLTFGNAKPIGSVGFSWQSGVIYAIFINTFAEGNWLLLFPLLTFLVVWRWRAAIKDYLGVTAFIAMVSGGQIILYLFTALAAEARMQTGLARGVIQQLPVIVLLTGLLLADAREPIVASFKELAGKYKKMIG